MKTFVSLLTLAAMLTLPFASGLRAESSRRPGLVKPKKELFKHEKHTAVFTAMNVQCMDCHSFSVKAKIPGPTSAQVKDAMLRDTKGTCHQCHLGKVVVPLRKGCLLCHSDLGAIKPQDHYSSWKLRHGKLSQIDKDTCINCHNAQDCTSCHAKQNTLNAMVHRPNFRMSHSVQARMDPQSCSVCHKSSSFCMDCHTGRKR